MLNNSWIDRYLNVLDIIAIMRNDNYSRHQFSSQNDIMSEIILHGRPNDNLFND